MPEAIDKYRILAEQVFSKRNVWGKDGAFKASNLEKAIKDAVQAKLGPDHADKRMFTNEGRKRKIFPPLKENNSQLALRFVCAVPAKHINKVPRLFCTWEADKCPGYNCTI